MLFSCQNKKKENIFGILGQIVVLTRAYQSKNVKKAQFEKKKTICVWENCSKIKAPLQDPCPIKITWKILRPTLRRKSNTIHALVNSTKKKANSQL